MELITKEIAQKLPPLYSQDEVADPVCHLKFFTPDANWTWYISEGEQQEDGDWVFFAKVVTPIVPDGELGTVTLSELKTVRGALGLPVERDLWWEPKPLSECK